MDRLQVISRHLTALSSENAASSSLTMPKGLRDKLQQFRATRNFQPRKWIDEKIDKLNKYMSKSGLKACVVSVSGGIDSAVTYALMIEASKKRDSPIQRTLGIAQPIHSTSSVWKRAYDLKVLGGEIITVDQTKIYDDLTSLVRGSFAPPMKSSQFADGQLRSYMRTPVNYYVAQMLSANGTPCIVMGTGNYDEDGYLRYFCKAGDGTVDVQLIADLHKSEVFSIAKEMGVPKNIISAPPTADLWEDQTDEDEMGFPYDFVELYTTYLKLSQSKQRAFVSSLDADSAKYFKENGDKAKQIHDRNAHKASWPINI